MSRKRKGICGEIPVRKIHLQFAIHRESLKPDKPLLILPGKTPITMFLDSVLTQKTAVREDKRDTISDQLTERLPFMITKGVSEWGQLFYTPTRIIKFNTFLRRQMMDSLVSQIRFNKRNKISETQTIYQFIEEYKLYSANFEALKKATYRYRKAQKIRCFGQGNV